MSRSVFRFVAASVAAAGVSLGAWPGAWADEPAQEAGFLTPGAAARIAVAPVWQEAEGAAERRMLRALARATATLDAAREEGRGGELEFRTFDAVLPAPGEAWGEGPRGWHAHLFDPATGRMHEGRFGADGTLETVSLLDVQPAPSPREWERILERLAADPQYGPLLAAGVYEATPIMPPTDEAPGAARIVHLALEPLDGSRSSQVIGYAAREDLFVAFEGGAPERAWASDHGASPRRRGSCGLPPNTSCSINSGGSGILAVSWPAQDPVWSFDVVRPRTTRTSAGATPLGTGVELRNLRFEGNLVFLAAHMPVLNVLYDDNQCGPYRDWLYAETCFDVPDTGTTPMAGFHLSDQKSASICDDNTDLGNFGGVSLTESGDAIRLLSEMSAGQYRYIMGWELTRAGSVNPLFQLLTTDTSCTCVSRTHHGYWRFDVAIDANADAGVEGGWAAPIVFERRTLGGEWERVASEQAFFRSRPAGEAEFRVRNTATGVAYEIVRGEADGSAQGDTYGRLDLAVLAWDAAELCDANGRNGFPSSNNTFINLDPYLGGESVEGKRLSVWYGFHQRVNVVGGVGDSICTRLGPALARRTGVFDVATPSGMVVGRTIP